MAQLTEHEKQEIIRFVEACKPLRVRVPGRVLLPPESALLGKPNP